MTAREMAAVWREVETCWLLIGEVEHARLCGALAHYWSQPFWKRFARQSQCFALHQDLILSTRRLLNDAGIVKQ
jgi:hypothetical protein